MSEQQVSSCFDVTPRCWLALFNWHSCRRGGATHAYWTGTDLDLLAPHGGWNSKEGLQVYIRFLHTALVRDLTHVMFSGVASFSRFLLFVT